jgi:aminotransferase
MTGWRLGYAVGPQPIIERMGLISDLIYICAPTPLQHGVAAAFGMDDTYFEQMTIDYAKKRALLCSALEDAGFLVNWPQGAYYVLADFSPLAERYEGFEDDYAASRTMVERAGIGTVAGRSFFENPEDGRHLLRFCYAKEFDELERACSQLREAFAR